MVFSLQAPAQQAVTKVAVINIQQALVGTQDGQKATKQMDDKFLPLQKAFEARQTELIQLQDQLTKGSAVLSDDKRNQMARNIDEKKKRLERDMQDAEDDMKSQQQKLLAAMATRMTSVIGQYSKDNGFSLVLDVANQNTPVLFAAGSIDITKDVIALCDKGPAAKP